MTVDPNVAQEGGMALEHAERLREFCSQRIYRRHKLLVIVRGSNEDSLEHHGHPGMRPKHSGVKGKTKTGIAGAGRRFEGAVAHGNRAYYSDYDLLGVFIQDGRTYRPLFTGNYNVLRDVRGKVLRVVGAPGLNEFLHVINQYVCGKGQPKMFIHGAQDDYLVDGKPQLFPHREEKFLVFEPAGEVHLISGSRHMMMYYQRNGLRWRYGQLSQHTGGGPKT